MTIEAEVPDTQGFTEAKTFTVLGTPLLSKGTTHPLVALSSNLWIHLFVIAEGGERVLHAHPREDHAFFLLAGKAKFEFEEQPAVEIGEYEGIMIPRGVRYSFISTSDENLIILRSGASDVMATPQGGRPKATLSSARPGDRKQAVHSSDHQEILSGEVFTATRTKV